jgi:DNA modification methylase
MNFDQILCCDANAILPTFAPSSADLVVTDPPYLVRYRDRSGRSIANDDRPESVLPAFAEIFRVLKPDSYCLTFYGWTEIAAFSNAWANAGFRTVGHIVWPKRYASRSGHTRYQHESAFVLAKGFPPRPCDPLNDVQPWAYSGNRAHPTEKAVSVIAPLIKAFSKPGDLVLDPFAGSGTTAVAAALNGRRYIGIEIEDAYCTLARKRLAGVSLKLCA